MEIRADRCSSEYWKTFGKTFLFLALMYFIAGCNTGVSFRSAIPLELTSTKIASVTNTPVPLPSATPRIFLVPFGSDVVVDQMKVKVSDAIRPADGMVSAGSLFNPQPGAYQHYVFVDVNIICEAVVNTSCHLDPFKITLSVSDGSVKYPSWFLTGVDGILQDVDFQSGATASGYVPFIVSYRDSGLQLMYESSSGDEYSFALP